MNYKEEQKAIKELVMHLQFYLVHNFNLEIMREEFGEVSSEFVQKATFMVSVLDASKSTNVKKIKELLPIVGQIMKEDDKIRGFGYYESLQNRNESSQKECQHCESKFKYKTSKQKFCSNKCKTAYHRSNQLSLT